MELNIEKKDKACLKFWFCEYNSDSALSLLPPPLCLAFFVRVLREHQQDQQQQGDNRWYRTIGDGTSAYMTSAEANASQLWNASFSDAILGESVGLINRPTALKGADGKWEGVVATPTAATERRIPRTAMRDIHPHGAAGWCGKRAK